MRRACRDTCWLKCVAALLALVFTSSPTDARADEAPARNFAGPFELAQALYVHAVNETGKDFAVRMVYRDPLQVRMDRPVLIRVFDPEEREIERRFIAAERVQGDVPSHVVEFVVPARGAGVYQIALNGFGGSVELDLTPDLPFGLFGYPELVGRDAQFDGARIFVPPGADAIHVQSKGAIESWSLINQASQEPVPFAGAPGMGRAAITGDAKQVWRLNVKAAGEYRLNFAGLPIILCPDEATARAIHSSVDVLDDGTICFHKFQARAHEILKRYRALEASAFAVAPPILIRHKQQWIKDPVRNQLLLGPYGVYSALDAVLQAQIIDRASPWFGTINVGRDERQRPRQDDPWKTYSRLGLTHAAQHTSVLAAVYSIDEPFNPLHKNEGLRNRIIIAALQSVMMVREHEMPHPVFTEYDGDRAFAFADYLCPFPLAARDCPTDVREVWTDGLRHMVDRQCLGQVASTVNQWTFIVRGVQDFTEGTGEEWYSSMVQRHLRWIVTRNLWDFGQAEAGYFAESEGPDATYNGITNHNLAVIYERTRDAALKEALRKCIDLFNHTIAPEPDGTWLGSSSFCHRTPGDWTMVQFGGGFGMLADDLTEAAAHVGRGWLAYPRPKDMAGLRAAEQALVPQLAYLDPSAATQSATAHAPLIHFEVWKHSGPKPLPGALPVLESRNFIRHFGEEFFCVRRPKYYAFIYAGKPMGEWQKARRPKDGQRQHPHNGGGLCMFWSPAFGSSLLAKNWSAYAANTFLIENKGQVDWEDYWSTTSRFDAGRGEATVSGAVRDQPITFERRCRFLDEAVDCQVELRAKEAANFDAVWECFPYPLDKPAGLRVTLLDERGQPIQQGAAAGILFHNDSPEAHLVVFAQPRLCEIDSAHSTDVYQQRHEYGRVLAAAPAQWQAGQVQVLRWRIMAVGRNGIASALRAALREMQAD